MALTVRVWKEMYCHVWHSQAFRVCVCVRACSQPNRADVIYTQCHIWTSVCLLPPPPPLPSPVLCCPKYKLWVMEISRMSQATWAQTDRKIGPNNMTTPIYPCRKILRRGGGSKMKSNPNTLSVSQGITEKYPGQMHSHTALELRADWTLAR